jgi:Holin of 3TMs, for gene-transfer release
MNPLLLGPLFEIGKTLIDRFVPDPEKKAAAEMELVRMAADGELKQVIAQLAINAQEAVHPSIFVAGWRPFFGWAGGIGFIYSVMIQPMLAWYSGIKGWPVPPALNIDLLWVVITGMLGIGGLRTFEKSKGVTK